MKYISLSLFAVLLLTSCGSDRPFPKIALGPNPVEPIWSSYVGCSGGMEIGSGTLSVARRVGDEYELWKFDVASGTLISYQTRPTRISGAPNDIPGDLTAGSAKPLNSSNARSLTPSGFTPVALTDQFLFAKRSRNRLQRFRIYSEGQVVLIDRPSRKAVWVDEGSNISVLAVSDRLLVCRDGQVSIFAQNAGRPPEISAFYRAIQTADVGELRRVYPIWRKTRIRDVDGKVPLSVAAKNGLLAISRLLVELGENPNTADADGFTPLMMALHWNHANVGEFLLDAGAVPTDGGPIWGPVLEIAVREGGRTIVNRLLRAGARIEEVETWSGRTALHEAVMYRNYEAIETLISAGANIQAKDKDGQTPSQLAPMDRCIAQLFTGRRIKDEPAICQPIKRETVSFDPTRH